MPAPVTLAQIQGVRDVYIAEQARSEGAPATVRSHLELQRQLLDELIDRREVEECGGWISVNQMLPDDDLLVLAWCEYGQVVATLSSHTWKSSQTRGSLIRVTAWQHLPADYEPKP